MTEFQVLHRLVKIIHTPGLHAMARETGVPVERLIAFQRTGDPEDIKEHVLLLYTTFFQDLPPESANEVTDLVEEATLPLREFLQALETRTV